MNARLIAFLLGVLLLVARLACHVTACRLADRLRETCHFDAADLIDPRVHQERQ